MNIEEITPEISAADELFDALLMLKNRDDMERFIRDLCTPQEISVLAERWRVCKLLAQEDLSYREINQKTGASLATITRVARFLRTELHQGYAMVLKKMNINRKNKNA